MSQSERPVLTPGLRQQGTALRIACFTAGAPTFKKPEQWKYSTEMRVATRSYHGMMTERMKAASQESAPMTVRLDGTGTSGRPPTLVGHKGPSSAASQLFVVRKEASAVVIQPVDTWYNFRAVYEGEQAPTLAPMDEEDQAKDAAARAQFAALMSDASREAFLKEQRGEMGDAARSRDTQKVKALADELGMGSDSDDGGSAGNFVMPGKGPKMQGGEEYVDVEVDPETGFKEAGFDLKEDWEFEQHFSDDEEDAKKAEGGLRVDMDDQDEAEAELEREMAPPKSAKPSASERPVSDLHEGILGDFLQDELTDDEKEPAKEEPAPAPVAEEEAAAEEAQEEESEEEAPGPLAPGELPTVAHLERLLKSTGKKLLVADIVQALGVRREDTAQWTAFKNAVKEGVEVTRTIIKGKKDANMTLEYGGEKGGGVVGEKRGRGVGTGARDRKRARLGQ